MRGVKRGIKSVLLYWKKNILFVAALLIVSSVLGIMASVQENVNTAIEETGTRIKAELSVRIKDVQAFSYHKNIYYAKDIMKSIVASEEVDDIEYVTLANAHGEGVEGVFSEAQNMFKEASEEMGVDYYGGDEERRKAGEIRIVGIDNLDKAWDFDKRGMEVTQGKGISQENNSENVAVVSEEFLNWNMLKLGDEITLVNTDGSMNKMTVKIIGTHSGNYDGSLEMDCIMNHIYVPLDTCLAFNGEKVVQSTVIVNNPKNVKKTMAKIENYLGDDFEIKEDRMTYLQAVTPLKGVQQVGKITCYITYCILVLILFLIIGRLLLNSRKEIGIWRSLGEKRRVLFVQFSVAALSPLLFGMLAGNVLLFVCENSLGTFIGNIMTSFSNIRFQILWDEVWKMSGVTFVITIIIFSVFFFKICRDEITDLLRIE